GTVRRILNEKPGEFDPRKYLAPAREALKQMYMHKNIDVLGSAGQA
ncbi:MAG: fructose-bisphosphate aldolase, partial [Sphaerochaetaceae bacterium]|nr:fructose-bisphosphate aldolase [Sphaerochaetaceae bacterium]